MGINNILKVGVGVSLAIATSIALSGCAAGHSSAFDAVCKNNADSIDYQLKWASSVTMDSVEADAQSGADTGDIWKLNSMAYVATMQMYAHNMADAAQNLSDSESELGDLVAKVNTDADAAYKAMYDHMAYSKGDQLTWFTTLQDATADTLSISTACLAK